MFPKTLRLLSLDAQRKQMNINPEIDFHYDVFEVRSHSHSL
ncbi:hypothetical protein [Nostoc cycadae]|nr:hypothetical protein [Nostoc cycadae]